MRRCTSVFALLVTAALATTATGVSAPTPVITVSVKMPRVGDPVTVAVPASGTCGRMVAVSPMRSQYPIRLSRRGSVCRGTFRFRTEGQWTLRFGRLSKVIRVRVALPTPHPSGAPLGRPGCEPASPLTLGREGPAEAFGTTVGGQLWALFFPFRGTRASDTEAVFASMVGDELKLVLKRTGGMGVTTATAPDGTKRKPIWQQAHGSSSWERAGGEWGTGWQITEPGCWRIHVGSVKAGADLWFTVLS